MNYAIHIQTCAQLDDVMSCIDSTQHMKNNYHNIKTPCSVRINEDYMICGHVTETESEMWYATKDAEGYFGTTQYVSLEDFLALQEGYCNVAVQSIEDLF